jgi:hypothetical protein
MLHRALGEPKRALWYRGAHGEVPDGVLAEMRRFLAESLELNGPTQQVGQFSTI